MDSFFIPIWSSTTKEKNQGKAGKKTEKSSFSATLPQKDREGEKRKKAAAATSRFRRTALEEFRGGGKGRRKEEGEEKRIEFYVVSARYIRTEEGRRKESRNNRPC